MVTRLQRAHCLQPCGHFILEYDVCSCESFNHLADHNVTRSRWKTSVYHILSYCITYHNVHHQHHQQQKQQFLLLLWRVTSLRPVRMNPMMLLVAATSFSSSDFVISCDKGNPNIESCPFRSYQKIFTTLMLYLLNKIHNFKFASDVDFWCRNPATLEGTRCFARATFSSIGISMEAFLSGTLFIPVYLRNSCPHLSLC